MKVLISPISLMKNIWKYLLLAASVISLAGSCQKETQPDEKDPQEETPVAPTSGISNIKNSYTDKEVSHLGSTVSIKFDASAAWSAKLVLKTTPDVEWASISTSMRSRPTSRFSRERMRAEAYIYSVGCNFFML